MPPPHVKAHVKVNRCLLTLHASGRADSNNAAHTQASVALGAYLYVEAVDVCNGVDCYGAQAHFFAGSDHAHSNLSPICD